MSDGPHHPIAEAMRIAGEEAAVRDRLNAPGNATSSHFGQGLGGLTGWVFLFGMIGAVLGGILGRGIAGAVGGAVFVGGGMAVVGFVASKTSFIWNRGPAWLWGIGGAVVGAFFGSAINSDPSGWGIAGAMAFWGFRAVTREE